MLTLIAFIYGIIVSYMQLYDGFCIKELELNQNQNLKIDLLINDTKYVINEQCTTAFINNSGRIRRKFFFFLFFINLFLISYNNKFLRHFSITICDMLLLSSRNTDCKQTLRKTHYKREYLIIIKNIIIFSIQFNNKLSKSFFNIFNNK
jgi:hypothetical protein